MIPVSQVREILCTPPGKDVLLGQMIDQATATLGRALLEWLGPITEFVEVRDVPCCSGRFRIALRKLPVAVSKVEQRRSAFLPYEEVGPLADDGYPAYVTSGRDLVSRAGFLPGAGALQVTYTSGYDVSTGPLELQSIVEALVVGKYRGLTASTGALKSETLGDYNYTRFGLDELMAQSGWESVSRKWKRMLI